MVPLLGVFLAAVGVLAGPVAIFALSACVLLAGRELQRYACLAAH